MPYDIYSRDYQIEACLLRDVKKHVKFPPPRTPILTGATVHLYLDGYRLAAGTVSEGHLYFTETYEHLNMVFWRYLCGDVMQEKY